MSDALVVLTTVETVDQAETLARMLVERQLAACVQILPLMTSFYRWQGQVEQAREILLLIKTLRNVYPQLEAAIRQDHPYQTPEIIALPVSAGWAGYLSWLEDAVQRGQD